MADDPHKGEAYNPSKLQLLNSQLASAEHLHASDGQQAQSVKTFGSKEEQLARTGEGLQQAACHDVEQGAAVAFGRMLGHMHCHPAEDEIRMHGVVRKISMQNKQHIAVMYSNSNEQ